MADGELMSAEEMKNRLFNSLKEKGLVNALKSQLRNKLVAELQQVGLQQHFQTEYSSDGSLLHKASNSLVAHHLRGCQYDYSLSVFLPECGLAQGQLLTIRDLLQLLNISPHSKLYQNLVSQTEGHPKKGFLWQLLSEISSLCGSSSVDTGIQTDPSRFSSLTSLEEQFRKLDLYYSSVGDEQKNKWMAVEERILSYQRQLEERSKRELQLEIARFKENELARMRMEERDRYRQELDRIRREMEQTYRSKVEALSQREHHLEEKIKKEKEILEKEIYSERQSLLAEIDAVRQKEVALRHKEEVIQREKLLWEERLKTREELLKKREEAVRMAEIEYNQKLQDEIKKFKMQEESRILEKTKDLDYREMRVRENERRLDEELRNIHETKEELRQKRKLCLELEGELSVVKHDLINARGELELLTNKVREMVDYQKLKEDDAVHRRELDNLKMRIAELSKELMVERQKNEELLREMSMRASKPAPEVYLMKKEVEKIQNEMKQERAIFEHIKSNLEKRYQDEIERNHELLRKFEEQTLQIEEMNREIRDLRQQLGEHHTALTNEVYRKAKPSLLRRPESPCDLDADAIDPNLIRTSAEPELLYSASHGLLDSILDQQQMTQIPFTSQSEDYSYSSDIVEETKRRLRNLEREAENLEHHYQDFQYRMSTVHALDDPVPSSQTKAQAGHLHTEHISQARSSNNIQQQQQTSKQHQARPSQQTPASSTPAKLKPFSERMTAADSLLDNSMSTVQSSSPQKENVKIQVTDRPLNINDLSYRPGSPQLLVLPGSDHQHQPQQTAGGVPQSSSDPPQDTDFNVLSLDDAWKHQQSATENLTSQQAAEDQQKDQDLQTRSEDTKKKSDQAESVPSSSDKKGEGKSKEEDKIDPTLLKYMEIVKQQKEKEKQMAKKTVETWNKNKQDRTDRTPSQSEDLSVGIEKSEPDTSDGDFW